MPEGVAEHSFLGCSHQSTCMLSYTIYVMTMDGREGDNIDYFQNSKWKNFVWSIGVQCIVACSRAGISFCIIHVPFLHECCNYWLLARLILASIMSARFCSNNSEIFLESNYVVYSINPSQPIKFEFLQLCKQIQYNY